MVIDSWMWCSPSPPPPFPGMYFFFFFLPLLISFYHWALIMWSLRSTVCSHAWETSIYPVFEGNHGELTQGDKDAGPCWTRGAELVRGAKPNGRSSHPLGLHRSGHGWLRLWQRQPWMKPLGLVSPWGEKTLKVPVMES